jgi:hypothetical protein
VPLVAGNCGASPAIRRSTVLLPQPLGPSTPTNSPMPGLSSTWKVTSRIAVKALRVPG